MAEKKDEKAKDEKTEGSDEGQEEKKGKRKLLIIIIAGVVLLVVGGALAFFLMGSGKKGEDAEGGHGAEAKTEEKTHSEEGHGEKAPKKEHGDKKEEGHGEKAPKKEHGDKKEEGHGEKAQEGHGEKASKKEHGDKKEEGKEGKEEHGETSPEETESNISFGASYSFPPFHLNLGNPLENRYIRLEVAVEYKSGQDQLKEIEARKPQLRDAILSVVSRKSREFLLGPDGKDQLRLEILNKINQYMDRKVEAVYITDMIIE